MKIFHNCMPELPLVSKVPVEATVIENVLVSQYAKDGIKCLLCVNFDVRLMSELGK
jgi:hypothetical protein